MEIIDRKVINKILKETIKDYPGAELYISQFPTKENPNINIKGTYFTNTYLKILRGFTLMLDVNETYIRTRVIDSNMLKVATRIFNMNGEKLFSDLDNNRSVLVGKNTNLEKTGFLVYQILRKGSTYIHYEVKNGELVPLQLFEGLCERDSKDKVLSIYDKKQSLTYHYNEGIADPYNFFNDYTDTFLGVDYGKLEKHVGVGTLTLGENTHTIVGVVDNNGTLASRLLDWNTSCEYGVPYMDPSMFDESIDEIKKDMIDEDKLRSLEGVKRAKINMKIMHGRK